MECLGDCQRMVLSGVLGRLSEDGFELIVWEIAWRWEFSSDKKSDCSGF